ncbi:hydantoinase B/oxoprolinase family protein [Gracilibacillus xinjiangensis]|uniref:Hydantoinase B/oxoprolinase family protein n=1 Tax=Gracilibacillus xinjiangensis TaxID=1193282 RepID=A0ABV8WVB7_9BACI
MIESQINYSKLQAVSRQMGETLQRISRSPLVSQDRTFATAIFTSELSLAVQHQYEPEHLFAVKESVNHLFEYFSFDISDGDILLTADPYNGGTKGQTLTMAAPLFDQGELVLFPVLRVQMMDLAGEYPGGFNPDAFEVWQENIRITPIKLYKQGLLQRDVLRFFLANSRVESVYEAELQSMYACLRAAQEQLLVLIKQYRNQLDISISEMQHYSNRRVVEQINQLPKDNMSAELLFKSNNKDLSIQVSVSPTEDKLKIDFDGTIEQVALPVNATLPVTKAFAVWPILAPIAEEITINQGILDAFEISAPKGSLLHPKFPASVGFNTAVTGHFISEVITTALRNASASETLFSEIHGPGPQAILFPPFGQNKETEPLFLVPGYPESKQGFGPSGLFGDRKLVSAEELEFNYSFKMIKREKEANQMTIRLVNEGDLYQVVTIIPEKIDHSLGEIRIMSKGDQYALNQSTAGISFHNGDEIEFVYEMGGNQ